MELQPHPVCWGALFPPGTSVVALPSWRRPRLLVPAESHRGIWNGVRFYPAYRWTGRLYRELLRVRSLAGVGARRAEHDGAGDLLTRFLADVAPGATAVAVQVGMPGGAQKLTAKLVDAGGRVVGFLKCAEQPLARERLRNEHAVLRGLPVGTGPTVLKYDAGAALDLLLLAPVEGRHPPASLDPSPALRRFVASLATGEPVPLDAHPWLRSFDEQGMSPAPVSRHLDAIAARAWRTSFRHGDLAPWNLLGAHAGALVAIDWEYGSARGLPGLDLAQYVLQVAMLLQRTQPSTGRDAAAAALARVMPELDRAACDALAALAAYETYCVAEREGLPAADPRQAWRRAVWESCR